MPKERRGWAGARAALGRARIKVERRLTQGLHEKGLRSSSNAVQARAIGHLTRLGSKRAIPAIRELAGRRGDYLTRKSAIIALGKLDPVNSFDLIERLAREEPERLVKWVATSVYADLAPERAIPLIEEIIKDRNHQVSHQKAVGKLGEIVQRKGRVPKAAERAFALIEESLGSKYYPVREAAVSTLGEINSPEAIALIQITAETHKKAVTRAKAASMLGEIGSIESIPLLEKLAEKDRSGSVRGAAMVSLGHLRRLARQGIK